METAELHDLTESIMALNMQRMQVATGIISTSGATVGILRGLKECAAAFASGYNDPVNHDELIELAKRIEGYLRTLQVLNVVSVHDTDKLIDQLVRLRDALN